MKALLFVLLTSFALNAFACLAMLVDEYEGGNVTQKVCVYNHLFDTVTQVVRAGTPSPSNLQVDH